MDRDSPDHGPKRIVILGSPGTGKTTTAIERFFAPAVRDTKAVRYFTFGGAASLGAEAKALEELAGRLSKPDAAGRIMTLHSQGLGMIKAWCRRGGIEEPRVLGTRPDGRPLDRYRTNAGARPWEVVACAQSRLISLDDARRALNSGMTLAGVQRWLDGYEAMKLEKNMVDFGDMLDRPLKMPPPSLDLLIIDEAQDLTPQLWRFALHLFEGARSVVLLGDPDQGVHEWMGADVHALERRAELEAEGFVYRRLEKSHRVPQKIYAVAIDLISRNRGRLEAPYEPADREGVSRSLPRTRRSWRSRRPMGRAKPLSSSHGQTRHY